MEDSGIRRVFILIDPDEFRIAFINWIGSIKSLMQNEVVSIDGKTLRGSHNKRDGKAAIHMVSAWASEMNMVVGQVKTEEKSNEITAIPELLDLLEISGCIVTIDAMGCQKKIAAKIIEKDADYVLALKKNQGTLHDDVELFLQDAKKTDFKDIQNSYHETIDGDHGRIETRRHWVVSDIDWLDAKSLWKGLASIGMVEREREIDGEITCEVPSAPNLCKEYVSGKTCSRGGASNRRSRQ